MTDHADRERVLGEMPDDERRPGHLDVDRDGRREEKRGFHYPWETLENLRQEPPIGDLITGILPGESTALMYGKRGSTKSFLAIEWVCCVITGRSWHGHAVRSGRAVYVAAEGGRRIIRRFDAWENAHGEPLPVARLLVLRRAVQLSDAVAVRMLARDLRVWEGELPIRLLVIDTLARSALGKNENTTQDMGPVLEACSELVRGLGITVVLVDHAGWDGRHERGATAKGDFADLVIRVERKEANIVTVSSTKTRDDASFTPMTFRLRGEGDSCVLERLSATQRGNTTSSDLKCLRVLMQIQVDSEPVLRSTWKAQAKDAGVGDGTFNAAVRRLLAATFVQNHGKRGGYTLTKGGRKQFGDQGAGAE